MRYPWTEVIRPLEEDEVDRSEVEVQRCMELTDTNRSKAYPVEGSGEEEAVREDLRRYSVLRV